MTALSQLADVESQQGTSTTNENIYTECFCHTVVKNNRVSLVFVVEILNSILVRFSISQ